MVEVNICCKVRLGLIVCWRWLERDSWNHSRNSTRLVNFAQGECRKEGGGRRGSADKVLVVGKNIWNLGAGFGYGIVSSRFE